ncbi:MAG: hypothetical protein ACREQL_14730 [Candidatus Binatia bacterium]
MVSDAIQLGDRVINLQVPGIFTVIDRKGSRLVIRSRQGLQMTVLEPQVRRVDEGLARPTTE